MSVKEIWGTVLVDLVHVEESSHITGSCRSVSRRPCKVAATLNDRSYGKRLHRGKQSWNQFAGSCR